MENISFFHLLFKLLTIVIAIKFSSAQTQCKDETGKVVDWYTVYKFPRIKNGASPIDTGVRYSYITSESNATGWVLSDKPVNSTDSIFGQTLKSLYCNETNGNLSYFLYNDDPPGHETDGSHAHAKGVVVTDDTNGYWLIHSVPKLASAPESLSYIYPTNGGRYGQIALCISFNTTEIEKIVEQLIYMEANIYSARVNSDIQAIAPQATNLRNSNFKLNKGHSISTINITSTAGRQFVSFSKHARTGADLYDSIVGPNLGVNLYVETWRKNPGNPLNSSCSVRFHVQNVEKIKIKFRNTGDSPAFNYTEDHSKWAISQESEIPYVCVGDINRMQSQFKRGGGTTCFLSPFVWNSLRDWIVDTSKC